MATYGDASINDTLNGINNLYASLYFQSVYPTFLHYTTSVPDTFLARNLITTKRHVTYYQCTLSTISNTTSMINHLIDSHWQCSGVANHDIRSRIADEYAVNSCSIQDRCCGEVVCCKHSYLITILFHLKKPLRRNLFLICYQISRHIFYNKFFLIRFRVQR